jgi:hypothetical protein
MPKAPAFSTYLPQSPASPCRRRTAAEITTALERLGFSVQLPLRGPAGSAGLAFLAGLLAAEDAGRPAEDPPAGHAASLTEERRARIQGWLDERLDAFNEDLSRILLGELSPAGLSAS